MAGAPGLPNEDPRAARIAKAEAEGDAAAVIALADEAAAALATDAAEAPFAGRVLEAVVRQVARNRRDLLPQRAVAPLLRRVVKDPWCITVPALDPGAIVAALPRRDLVSVRLDPDLALTGAADGPVGRAVREGDRLVFSYRRQKTVTVCGPLDRIELLEELVAGPQRLLLAELEALLLPRDLGSYRTEAVRLGAEVEQLLVEGRDLVERAERLVCRLFACDQELEDAVIARAAERAALTLVAAEDADEE